MSYRIVSQICPKKLIKLALPLTFISLMASEAALGQIRGAPNEKPMMLRNGAGQPCLKLRSLTRTDLVVKDNYLHIVIIENNCSRAISSKVCYRNSEFSCKQVRTRPYASETVLLGVRSGYPQFDFDYDERYLP